MNDQERITDLILLEKKMSTNYNEFASECTNIQLRNQFLSLLSKDHDIQSDLYQAATSRGWYQTRPADGAQINQTYQKFSKL
ncbi:MAG: spore coat protein [Clostridiales bacterium]|nr:spore coat protein [Clostridiales bacterium]